MKKILTATLFCFLITACGSSKSGTDIAQEVCDCYSKANGMKADDPGREAAQADCVKKQGEAWAKVKEDEKKSREFNNKISACAGELIKKSFQ